MAAKEATEAKKQKRRKTGKASKDKGKRGEREIANLLKEAGFKNAHRSAQCKGNTGDVADVEGLPGIHIEVKRVEKLNLKKAYEQAVNDSKENGNHDIPAVFHRQTREPWMVTLSLEDFLKLYKGEL